MFHPLVNTSSPASVLKLSSTRPLYGHNSVDLDQHPHGSGVGDPSTNGGKDDTAGNLDPYELFSRENHDRMKSIFNPKAIDHTSLKLISKLRNKKKHK